jgi:hypothetical protein
VKKPAIGVINGNWKNRWRRELEDATSDRREFIKQENQLNFGDALNELKRVDPNWESWFDNDANIPPVIYWLETAQIEQLCKRMNQRAISVTQERHEENRTTVQGGEEQHQRTDSPI